MVRHTLPALLVAVAILVATAAQARALSPMADTNPSYTGWGYVEDPALPVNCFQGDACGPGAWSEFLASWRWTGRSWGLVIRRADEKVWVAPFGAGWMWVWSQQVGWTAIRARNVYIGPVCTEYCPQ